MNGLPPACYAEMLDVLQLNSKRARRCSNASSCWRWIGQQYILFLQKISWCYSILAYQPAYKYSLEIFRSLLQSGSVSSRGPWEPGGGLARDVRAPGGAVQSLVGSRRAVCLLLLRADADADAWRAITYVPSLYYTSLDESRGSLPTVSPAA